MMMPGVHRVRACVCWGGGASEAWESSLCHVLSWVPSVPTSPTRQTVVSVVPNDASNTTFTLILKSAVVKGVVTVQLLPGNNAPAR
jgi:hypothetical protein